MNRITLHTKKNVDKTQYEIHFLATMTHKEINDQLQVHMLNEKKKLNKDIVLAKGIGILRLQWMIIIG